MIVLLMSLAVARPPVDLLALDRDALVDRFADAFERAPHGHAAAASGGRPACHTGLVQAIEQRFGELTPAQQSRVRRALDPSPANGQLPPPEGAYCVTQNKPARYESEHFIIEYDAVVSSEDARKFATALEDGLQALVVEQGWRLPDGMDDYKLTAVINAGASGGAYTTTRQCNGIFMPYIVTGRDAFLTDWYIGMAAHELKHAIQYAYSDAHEFWFWEASATWSEEWSNPELDSWSEYVKGFTDQPWIAMHASSQQNQAVFAHMYGMANWLFYLDHHVGGREIVQDIWAYSDEVSGMYSLSQRDSLEALGWDFLRVYRGFMAANTVVDYDNPESFPRVGAQMVIDALPADGGSQGRTLPQGYGQNYVRFDVTPDGPSTLDVEVVGHGGVPWAAVLVGGRFGRVEEMVPVDFDDDGVGTASLPDFGRYEEVWLAVSPIAQQETGFAWEFTADASPYVAPETVGGDLDGDGRPDGFRSLIQDASSCDTGAGGAWWAAPFLWLAARRARRYPVTLGVAP